MGVTYAGMTTMRGREKIRLDCGSYQHKHLAGKPNLGNVAFRPIPILMRLATLRSKVWQHGAK